MKQIEMRRTSLGILFGAIWMTFSAVPSPGAPPVRPSISVFTPGGDLSAVHEGLQKGLARLGYVDGQNVTFHVDSTNGASSDLPARAAKLIAMKPDLLFAVTNSHAFAAKQATSTVPIVFAWVGNPVNAGLVADYPYSKTNLTGVTASGDSLSGKRLEVLLEIAPKARRLLSIVSSRESVAVNSFHSAEEAAGKFGVKLIRRDVGTEQEIQKALEQTRGSIDAIFHVPSNLVRSSIDLLIRRALLDRIPMSVNEDTLVDRGALISYGPYSRLVGMQAANLVDKILKGAKPGEVIIEAPNKFFLAVNQTTAKHIAAAIPRGMLERADRLIP